MTFYFKLICQNAFYNIIICNLIMNNNKKAVAYIQYVIKEGGIIILVLEVS